MPLHVSALGGVGFSRIKVDVSLSFSVTVERILSTVDCNWSSWHSTSNSISPIFIFTRIGGFSCLSVNFSPYCLLNCTTCSCTTFKYSLREQLAIGESC